MFVLLAYIILVCVLTYLNSHQNKGSVFKSNKRVSWWISGISLYMLFLSVDQGQLLTGIITEHGMSGLWLVWAGTLGAFVVPLVFAPLWHKLNFSTDNQFILFRFPGHGGKILHRFRALYVGGIVVSFAVSFHLIGFARVLQVFYRCEVNQSLLLTGGIMLLFAMKNIFDIKLKLDVLHTFLFFLSILVIGYYLGHSLNLSKNWLSYFESRPHEKNLLPNTHNGWFSMFVFIGIQWWSCYLFDGGGAETARFTAVKTARDAVKVGLTPLIISFVLGFFMIGHVLALLSIQGSPVHGEISYVNSIYNLVPGLGRDIVFLGFFSMFITTSESLINWGASFLVIDAWKGWIKPQATHKETRILSFVAMALLCLSSIGIALNIDNLQQLIKITFSISAGVAPVFILRWFWPRINAWSQISAMLGSGIFTLLYSYIHPFLPVSQFPLDESRVLVVTILTTITWIVVTFLTENQEKYVAHQLKEVIEDKPLLLRTMIIAFLLGFAFLTLTWIIWYLILN